MDAWKPMHERAAQLIAEGKLLLKEIALEVGVVPRTIGHWKAGWKGDLPFPEFPARIEAIRKERADCEQNEKIGQRKARIKRMNEDWHRLQEIRRARSVDPAMQGVPGGTTGLIVLNKKGEYTIDQDLLAALGSLEALAAKEGSSLGRKAPEKPAATQEVKVVIEHVNAQDTGAGAAPGAAGDQE